MFQSLTTMTTWNGGFSECHKCSVVREHPSTDVLPSRGISFVRVQWVDMTNIVRYRVLPLSHFQKLLQSSRPGITMAKSALGLILDTIVDGFSPVGEYLYVIDTNSWRTCTYAPGHASVFGVFQAKCSVTKEMSLPVCPRTALQRIVRLAEQAFQTEFLVGIETEFILLKSTCPPIPVNNHGWCASSALPAGAVETQVMEEIATSLINDGIELQVYHSEAVNGQYEVVTGPLPPLEAADALIHTRETIYNTAHKHGLRATLAPRLRQDKYGSGAHVHVSVHRSSGSPPSPPWFDKPSLTRIEAQYLAGLLEHLPAVTALTLPLPQSYARMVDGVHAGGTWVCWGVDNREAPVRLTNESSPESRNFEIKTVDGTSNPHLALASLLAAGLIGIRDELRLTHENCANTKTAAEMSREERASMGICQRLPLSVEMARKHLCEDDKLREMLGDELVEVFIKVNEALGKAMKPEGESEAVTETRLVELF